MAARNSSFPGSAWERTGIEAPPHVMWTAQRTGVRIVELDPDFTPVFGAAAPNGARFDSPGRLALGCGTTSGLSPVGALFQERHHAQAEGGIPPRWGFPILSAN